MSTESPLPVIAHAIPGELTERRQWVAWKFAMRGGKPTKVPINPDMGSHADATGPSTWGTFAQSRDRQRRDNLAGVGFVFGPADPYCGIDFDKCRNPQTGEIDPEVRGMLGLLDSYSELSPSGTGVHVIARANLPGNRNRIGGIEIYDRGRFFTITGHVVPDFPDVIHDRQPHLDQFYRRTFGDMANTIAHPVSSDPSGESGLAGGALWGWAYPRLTPHMMRVANLDDARYDGDASRADEALCCALIGLGLTRAEVAAAFRASPRGPHLVGRKKHVDYLIDRAVNQAAAHVGEGKIL